MGTGLFGYCNGNKGAGKREKWQRDDKKNENFYTSFISGKYYIFIFAYNLKLISFSSGKLHNYVC